jgi:6-phosphogluconate dehydrogenase
MRLGLIGLGRMGFSLGLNMIDHGHEVIAFNRSREKTDELAGHGAIAAYSTKELMDRLHGRKIIWLMVTAGPPVDDMILSLKPYLKKGDILIDGGNSFYKDSIKRADDLAKKGIILLDIGTSGGIAGARNGACTMVGGSEAAFKDIESLLRDICVADGYGYFGRSGSGHFVKMVHNGIEYGMMQAMGEGMDVIENSGFDVDKWRLTKVWNHGSVVRGWLMELLNEAYAKDPDLSDYSGTVGLSGEGEWTVKTANELGVHAPVIHASVDARLRSAENKLYQGKVVQALRYGFGQHEEPK